MIIYFQNEDRIILTLQNGTHCPRIKGVINGFNCIRIQLVTTAVLYITNLLIVGDKRTQISEQTKPTFPTNPYPAVCPSLFMTKIPQNVNYVPPHDRIFQYGGLKNGDLHRSLTEISPYGYFSGIHSYGK